MCDGVCEDFHVNVCVHRLFEQNDRQPLSSVWKSRTKLPASARVPVAPRARHADSRLIIQGYSVIRVRWQLELRFIRGPQGSGTLIKNCLQPPAKLRSLFTIKYYLTGTSDYIGCTCTSVTFRFKVLAHPSRSHASLRGWQNSSPSVQLFAYLNCSPSLGLLSWHIGNERLGSLGLGDLIRIRSLIILS